MVFLRQVIWSRHVQRLVQTGSCPAWIVAFDWNTLDREEDYTAELDFVVDQLITQSGVEQVDLIGHLRGEESVILIFQMIYVQPKFIVMYILGASC